MCPDTDKRSPRGRRLFAAIRPDPAALQRIPASVVVGDTTEWHGLRWVEVANLHLTLAFLGPRGAVERSAIVATLRRVAEAHSRFTVFFVATRYFPAPSRPRVLVLSCRDSPPLNALQRELASGLRAIGIELPDRRFRPHLTLARVRAGGAGPAPRPITPIESVVSELLLFSSELHPDGARYRVEQRFELARSVPPSD